MDLRNFEDFKKFASEMHVKRAIVRVDFNLPKGDYSRIHAAKDTVLSLVGMGIDVVLIAHYKDHDDIAASETTLKTIAEIAEKIFDQPINIVSKKITNIIPCEDFKQGINILENLRANGGEKANDPEFAKTLASFGDVYINEAFSVSHRSHASIEGITHYVPSFAGISFSKEIENLKKVTTNIKRPYTAIVGGSKVSSKIDVLNYFSQECDYLIIAGAMANTFLKAKGFDLGASLVEDDCLPIAKKIMSDSKSQIILPSDFMVSANINTNGHEKKLEEITQTDQCFDIGPASIRKIIDVIDLSKTILWNGALGAFEYANFDISSKEVSKHLAQRTKTDGLISIIGGGETLASCGEYKSDMTYASTAGGAFLDFVSGRLLPGVEALRK